jgi:beta-phosphoglucomutase family hydrolase
MPRLLVPDGLVAILFDLDGVITRTGKVHAAAWKEMFDGYLRERADRDGAPFRPFELPSDYTRHVDGRLRQDGVRGFLSSRGIELPEGDVDDPPTAETVHGLGNRKNELVVALIASGGAEVYESSVVVVREAREAGLRTAVVSASKNCRAVLESVGIEDLFEVRVDGVVAARDGLPGKPAPDTFLAAASELGVAPERCAVIEDAISGVAAGRAGGFGWVVGVDREGHRDALLAAGADVVVEDLAELMEDR